MKATVDHNYEMFVGKRHAVLVPGCEPIIVGVVNPFDAKDNARTAKRAEDMAALLNEGFLASEKLRFGLLHALAVIKKAYAEGWVDGVEKGDIEGMELEAGWETSHSKKESTRLFGDISIPSKKGEVE